MPQTTPTNRIAFIDPAGQLGTVAPDGGELRLLTSGERAFQFPAWAPDNKAIAIIGSTEQDAGIYVVSEQSPSFVAAVHQVYRSHTQPPIYLSWSPDSSVISFLAIHPTRKLALYLTSSTGLLPVTQNSKPVITGQPCFWQWQADSRGFLVHVDLSREHARLAFVRLLEGKSQIGETTIEDLGVRPGYFQVPGLSADNLYWAYAEDHRHFDESRLIVESRAGKQRLVDYQGVAALAWSPVAAQLAFIYPTAEAQHIYGPVHLWDAASGVVQPLTEENTLAFFWSPDGQKIAYLTLDAQPQRPLHPTPTFTTNGRFVGSWPFMDPEVDSAPSEVLRLALHVVDIRSGRSQIITIFEPWALFVNQFLPFFDQYALSHRIWSPASDALVVPMVKRHQGQSNVQLCVVPINGRSAEPIAEGMMATWSW